MLPKAMKKASLITDGSCLGHPGPGGWACILRFGAVKKELFGYDPHTTNNRMELMAAIQGLLAFKEPCEVEITTDAEYVRQAITRWIGRWKRRHWWKRSRPTAGRMAAFVSTWAATTFLPNRRPVCSTLSIMAMTLMTPKMTATQASGPSSPHVEQAQPWQPRPFQQAALQVLLLQHG